MSEFGGEEGGPAIPDAGVQEAGLRVGRGGDEDCRGPSLLQGSSQHGVVTAILSDCLGGGAGLCPEFICPLAQCPPP